MIRKSKITIIHLIFSCILWLLGILTLLFNILGLWAPWHLAGFGFVFFIPLPIVFSIASLIVTYSNSNEKAIKFNWIILAISIIFIIITIKISATWFW